MSLSCEVIIPCSACHKKSFHSIWKSVNVDTDPELREKVLSNELFVFKCGACQKGVNLVYPVLYHDMTHRFWIQLVPNQDEDFESAPDFSPVAFKTMQGYRSRLVSNTNELREKIWLFESGLDDRTVEIVKWNIRKNALAEEGQVLDKPLLFFGVAQDKQGYPLGFSLEYLSGSIERTFFYAWESYLDLQEWLYLDMGIPEQEPLGWLRVDENYACQIMAANEESE